VEGHIVRRGNGPRQDRSVRDRNNTNGDDADAALLGEAAENRREAGYGVWRALVSSPADTLRGLVWRRPLRSNPAGCHTTAVRRRYVDAEGASRQVLDAEPAAVVDLRSAWLRRGGFDRRFAG
jgi:hypothetical protein